MPLAMDAVSRKPMAGPRGEGMSLMAGGYARPRARGNGGPARRLPGWVLLVQHERDHHVDLVARDLPVLHVDALLLDPGRGHVAQRLVGAGDAQQDGVLEALVRARRDLRDLRDRVHVLLPCVLPVSQVGARAWPAGGKN